MTLLRSWTAALGLLAASALSAQPRAAGDAALAITHVTVIDPGRSISRGDATVLVRGGRIHAVGPASSIPIPPGASVVDATGRYLIPGLWDMHTHTQGVAPDTFYFPLYVAHGVTGIRDMGNPPGSVRAWRAAIAAGSMLGPRLMAAGPFVDGPRPLFGGEVTIPVGTAAEGAAAVRHLHAARSDFVKLQSVVPREAYFALAREARRLGIPFAGHVPIAVTAREASDAGQRSIEHFTGVLLGSSPREAELRRAMLDDLTRRGFADAAIAEVVFQSPPAALASTYDPARARALIAHLRRNGTWQDPTFTMLRVLSHFDAYRARTADRLAYVPRTMREGWETNFLAPRQLTATQRADAARLFDRYGVLFRAMRSGGLDFLAGTDVGFPYVVPGFALHDELEELVAAGTTPLEALRIAAYNPARYFGMLDSLGTIEAGKVADLVLLADDPRRDIRNARRIDAVVLGGRLLDRRGLDAMLAAARGAADRH